MKPNRLFSEQRLVRVIWAVVIAPFVLVPLAFGSFVPLAAGFISFSLLCLLFGVRGALFLFHSKRLAGFEQRHTGIRFAVERPWQFNPFDVAESIVRWRAAVSQVLLGLLMIVGIVYVIVQMSG